MHSTLDADVLLAQVLEQFIQVMRRLGTAGELSFAAASALTKVVADGPWRLTELAGREGLSQPGMTQLVTRLEREGLVRRVPSADDRRVVLVEATAHGRDLVHLRRSQRADALGTLLDRLDPADRTTIRAALPALARLTSLALAGETLAGETLAGETHAGETHAGETHAGETHADETLDNETLDSERGTA